MFLLIGSTSVFYKLLYFIATIYNNLLFNSLTFPFSRPLESFHCKANIFVWAVILIVGINHIALFILPR